VGGPHNDWAPSGGGSASAAARFVARGISPSPYAIAAIPGILAACLG